MRVFISHSSKDKPAVEKLATALRERGIDAWVDKWEMGPGDDFIAAINEGLEEADAGIVVFSAHSVESRWVEAETSYLTYARIREGKPLIPVKAGDDAFVPPLLRPLIYRRIEEVEEIAGALLSRTGAPPLGPALGEAERLLISLQRSEASPIQVRVELGDQRYVEESLPELPAEVVRGREAFLRGFSAGPKRSAARADRAANEKWMAGLGRAMGRLCLPGDAAEAVAQLVDGSGGLGTTIEVVLEANDSELLGLPFEALRLPDDRLLATRDRVVMLRRLAAAPGAERAAPPGPLKILVAVGAPAEEFTPSVVLDQERELQNILDGVEEAQRREGVAVRILEVGHPEVIGSAIERDVYHVLHLSCHGKPGELELENEDGEPVPTTAEELLAPILEAGKPLPLAFLNCCHGGVEADQTASFAEELLLAGVPCVVAMQTSVTDRYAAELARSFYEHLARAEPLLASRALARARKELETERLREVQQGAPGGATQPEYATATIFVAGDEPAIADFSLDKKPLKERPVYEVVGPVPQLRIDDLIGRRRELRETLRCLRDSDSPHAGVVLTGIGGVGKSAVAGRAMQRLVESGFRVAAHKGKFDWRQIATVLAVALLDSERPETAKLASLLANPEIEDQLLVQLIGKALAEEPLVLVLDDFEQNLTTGGESFVLEDIAEATRFLAGCCRRGRLLVTSRHPLPGLEDRLLRIRLPPLSPAETRKLIQRLPGLRRRAPEELASVLRVIGGHPRMLEFLDALLHAGEGRLPHVTRKLSETAERAGLDPSSVGDDLEEGLHETVLLGMRDVVLEELLAIARARDAEEALLQLAVSNLPVSPAGLAHMLADGPADSAPLGDQLETLERLSLVFRLPDGSAWAHRWTAEGLASLSDSREHRERCNRAGRYRWWRVANESQDLGDAVEAVRNHLQGADWDPAAGIAGACFDAMRRFQQSASIAAFAGEVLAALPDDHPNYAAIADEEGRAHLALGLTDRATTRYEELQDLLRRRADAAPERADHQSDLAVSYDRLGDLYLNLGQGDRAREAYLSSLRIRERLAQAEPDRADYQRDLSISYNRMGDLYRALGQGDKAREAYLKDLAIAERLARAEPDRADYQRDLSISYERVGDLYRDLGEGDKSREAHLSSHGIRARLAQAEPDRADYQQDLSASFDRLGDFYRKLGQGDKAREAYLNSLEISERLAQAEPDRADYQRNLSVSYNKMGDLYRDLGQGDKAREAYLKDLAIAERLAQAEPDRADYQVDLAISCLRTGENERALRILSKLEAEGRLEPRYRSALERLRSA